MSIAVDTKTDDYPITQPWVDFAPPKRKIPMGSGCSFWFLLFLILIMAIFVYYFQGMG